MRRSFIYLGAVLSVLLLVAPSGATTVLQMNLEDMVDRAGFIYRGTVIDVTEGTLQAGGATLSTVTYKILVEETFKGELETVKGETLTELTMLGSLKAEQPSNGLQRFNALPGMPQLRVGFDYLLITTQPSAVGLSTTVGLGQGSFSISSSAKQELAVNEVGNAGLFAGMQQSNLRIGAVPTAGPVRYDVLAAQIRNLVSE